jgi:hypothetical protein
MAIDRTEVAERVITGALIVWTALATTAFVGLFGWGLFSGVRKAMEWGPSSYAPQQAFDERLWKANQLRNEMIDDARSSVVPVGTPMPAVRNALGEPDQIL